MARLDKAWVVETQGTALATELHRVLEVSHRQAKGLLDGGCVTVNGEVERDHGRRLEAGDRVQAVFDPGQSYQVIPKAVKRSENPFQVLFEDEDLVFVDKPAGLLTVPTEHSDDASLADAVVDHYKSRGIKRPRLYIVHRLDRYSSGVLVFARSVEALHGLKKIFENHDLHRVYRAILVGELPENSGTLVDKLVERTNTLKMAVVSERAGRRQPQGAKKAVTHYRVVERLPGHTVVEIKLETGRRNQIRVQFAERGFPLLGDQVYGSASPLLDRQALHAELLGFRHPVTDEPITIKAPLAPDMEAALKVLRSHRRAERAEAGVQGEEGIFQPKITKERKYARIARARRYEELENQNAAGKEGKGGKPGERPARFRKDGDAPARGERPARFRKDGDAPARGERPARFRKDGDAPARGERPARFRKDGDDPARGERPARFRKDGDAPARPGRPAKPIAPKRRK